MTGVTGSTGRDAATVNLDPSVPGFFDVYLLPGQGRAPGSITARIHVIRFISDLGEIAEDPLPIDINLKLDGFNIQNRGFNTDDLQNPGPPYPVSRTFDTLDLTFTGFQIEDDFGNQQDVPASPFQETFLDSGEFTAYRGRTTAMQFYMNDSMIDLSTQGPLTASLNRALFLDANRNPETGKMRGFLSDYLQFDISAVPNRPTMPSPLQFPPQESRASKVFATGDSFAIGDKDPRGVNGSNGLFVYLTPSSFFEGFYRPQDATTQVKSYELKQADPTVVGELRLITALKGKYRDYTEVFTNLHDTEFILLPKSGDGPKQDAIVLKRSGGTIVNMWFGTVDFSGSGSPTFRIYPIKNLYPASTAGEIRGTLPANDLVGVGEQSVSIGTANYWRNVRYGTFKFDSTAPSGLTKTGDFVVFRI